MYVDRAGMIDRYGQRELTLLTDRAGSGVLDEAVLDRAIADACALADSYIANRAALPLIATPPALARAVAAIAYHDLRGPSAGKEDAATRAYEAAIDWLREIAAGRATLDPAASAAAAGAPSTGGGARVSQGAGALTRETLGTLG